MREEGLRTVRRDPWSSSACFGYGVHRTGMYPWFWRYEGTKCAEEPRFSPHPRKGGIRPVSDGEGSFPSSPFFPAPIRGSFNVCPPFFGRERDPCPLPVRTLLSFRSLGFETSPTRRTFLRKEGIGIDPPQRVDSFHPKGTSPTRTPFPFSPTKPRKGYEQEGGRCRHDVIDRVRKTWRSETKG